MYVNCTPESLLAELDAFLEMERERNGGPVPALNPGHRRQFIWPRQSIAAQYNVKPTEFTRTVRFESHGEAFDIHVAETAFGFFGRCEALKAEAKGASIDGMLSNLTRELDPLFKRQFAISRTLGFSRRFDGHINELPPGAHLRLLFCEDRDVAYTAMLEIDAHAASGLYTPSLMRILEDESHPMRRSAQWCTLDIFEDLENVCRDKDEYRAAIETVRQFMKTASDDYVRAVYKAGDVLGDHVANYDALEVLEDVLLTGEQPYGRRSAIHGMIHLCEWLPEVKNRCFEALEKAAANDPDQSLRDYAKATIQDIARGGPHGPEPALVGEV